MSEPTSSSHAVRTDLLAVVLGSVLILAYLTAAWAMDPASQAAEGPCLSAPPASGGAADATAAPWVKNREPVPPSVLYPYSKDPQKQAPAYEAKAQSWHNRLLFPTVHCPYCGRRVPTRRGSYVWLIVGFIGQIGFSMRFLVQWIASERARASVIPVSFWYFSIFGSVLLLAYAISIMAWPVILGQAPNVLIYGRNLYFIKKNARRGADDDSGPEAQGGA